MSSCDSSRASLGSRRRRRWRSPARRWRHGWLPPEREVPPAGRRRVLCDESVPHDIAAAVVGHEVATVQALGWAGAKNGALLRAAREADYEVLVTVDRNMEYQQNIPASGLALIVIRARSTRVLDLLPAVPSLLDALPAVVAGTVTHVR